MPRKSNIVKPEVVTQIVTPVVTQEKVEEPVIVKKTRISKKNTIAKEVENEAIKEEVK